MQNTVYVVRASPERNLGVWGSLRREVFFALRGVAGESRLDFGGVVGERSRDFFGAIALVDAVKPCAVSPKSIPNIYNRVIGWGDANSLSGANISNWFRFVRWQYCLTYIWENQNAKN